MSGIHGTACNRGTTKGGTAGWRFAAAEWLHLAAAPTFMAMALLTGIAGGSTMDVLCGASTHGMPLNAMATMYLLMGAFQSTPWLKLIRDRGNRPSG